MNKLVFQTKFQVILLLYKLQLIMCWAWYKKYRIWSGRNSSSSLSIFIFKLGYLGSFFKRDKIPVHHCFIPWRKIEVASYDQVNSPFWLHQSYYLTWFIIQFILQQDKISACNFTLSWRIWNSKSKKVDKWYLK